MRNAAARGHFLDLIGAKLFHVSHTVFVRKFAFQHVAEDFHITMPMGAESLAGSNAVLIDNPQAAKSHVFGIVIIGKRKTMVRIQPPMVGMATLFALADRNHGLLLIWIWS